MTKLYALFVFATAVTLNNASATNLRHHDTSRHLATMEATESASSDFVFDESDSSESAIGDRFSTEVEASADGSSLLIGSEESSDAGSVDRVLVETDMSAEGSNVDSEDGSGIRLLVEMESNVDGTTPLDDVNVSEGADEDTTADADDADDDMEKEANSSYEPGTIRAAPIDESTWGSRKFDKSNLTWWR